VISKLFQKVGAWNDDHSVRCIKKKIGASHGGRKQKRTWKLKHEGIAGITPADSHLYANTNHSTQSASTSVLSSERASLQPLPRQLPKDLLDREKNALLPPLFAVDNYNYLLKFQKILC
jgi:hypothetical protein